MELHFSSARSAVVAKTVVLEAIHRFKYQRALWFENFLADLLNFRIDEDGVRDRPSVGIGSGPLRRHPEDEQAQRHIDLWSRQADTGSVFHGLHHVGDEAADLRRARAV